MTDIAQASFVLDLVPVESELIGTGRFSFTKQWSGDVVGSGVGSMLSAGDPGAGSAGYVVLETFTGSIGGRSGSLALQQFGRMHEGRMELRYEIVPGSGTDDLAGIGGTLELTVTDGLHEVRLEYTTSDPAGNNQDE
ncbi:MAG: DUF3224 domain-containing protein [Nakamurella sp.]